MGSSDGRPLSEPAAGLSPGPETPGSAERDEAALRTRLGIPPEAKHVLVFGETSHWDPELAAHHRGVLRALHSRASSTACCGRSRRSRAESSRSRVCSSCSSTGSRIRPSTERLRDLVNQRRLRLTGTGITTPDTVLPDTEAILRDYADGQQWLRDHGMTVEPRLAYLPDDFGHSPALPTMLVALGFDMAAVTRIDGMYFIGSDYRPQVVLPPRRAPARSCWSAN